MFTTLRKVFDQLPVGLNTLIAISLLTGSGLVFSDGNIGKKIYEENCEVCHSDDGTGAMSGVPDLKQKRVWQGKDRKVLLMQLVTGLKNQNSSVNMPPRAGNPSLTNKQLEEALEYMIAITSNKK